MAKLPESDWATGEESSKIEYLWTQIMPKVFVNRELSLAVFVASDPHVRGKLNITWRIATLSCQLSLALSVGPRELAARIWNIHETDSRVAQSDFD